MKIIPNRTLFRCDYCTKHRLTKAAAQRHELFCRHNPNNQHKCFGCQHLVHTTAIKGISETGELQRGGYQYFTCARFGGPDMYTYVAERRNMVHKLGEVCRMPLVCSGYEPERCTLDDPPHPENPAPDFLDLTDLFPPF